MESALWVDRVKKEIGPDRVFAGGGRYTTFGHDLFHTGCTPLAVIKPRSTDELATTIRVLGDEQVPMVARGGGMSYSMGYLPENSVALIDTRGLDRLEINEKNMTVRVGAGVTWLELDAALEERGLRTPFWGTGSGRYATVGATLSQHALNYGSGEHGVSAESVISLGVATGLGEVFETAGAKSAFFRHYGPDLTGLFLGDCGALGVKAEVTLQLMERPEHLRFGAWEIQQSDDFVGAITALGRRRLFSECFGFDPAFMKLRTTYDGVKAGISTLKDVVKKEKHVVEGLKRATSILTAGSDYLDQLAYSIHVVVEGRTASEADAKFAMTEEQMNASGSPIEPSVAHMTRSVPFPDPTILLARDGRRWIPVHGIIPNDELGGAMEALKDLFAEREGKFQQLGIDWATTFVPAGRGAMLVEPNLYWPDERPPLFDDYLPDDYVSRRATFEANPEAREVVDDTRRAIIHCLAQYGSTHFQIGRLYPYFGNEPGPAAALLRALKKELDPQGLMNPGVLGL